MPITTFRCTSCGLIHPEFLRAHTAFHGSATRFHFEISTSPFEDSPTDVVSMCATCAIKLFNGLLKLEVDNLSNTMQRLSAKVTPSDN